MGLKALEILNNYKKFDGFIRDIVSDSFLNEAITELELLQNDLKDLFSCIELTEDENAEKRLTSMETYLIRLSKVLK